MTPILEPGSHRQTNLFIYRPDIFPLRFSSRHGHDPLVEDLAILRRGTPSDVLHPRIYSFRVVEYFHILPPYSPP
jgi:hypothetical protein